MAYELQEDLFINIEKKPLSIVQETVNTQYRIYNINSFGGTWENCIFLLLQQRMIEFILFR